MKINFQGTAAVFGDTHNPYQDQRALHEVEMFLTELQPGLVIKDGDMNDFYGLSKFDKNPERKGKLQKDLNSTKAMNTRQRVQMPNSRQIHIDGNHEDRLRRYLWSKADELASLDALNVESLYGLTDNDIEYVAYGEGVLINGIFMIDHGNIVRAHSSYTAKGLSDKQGGSGMCGHTHRRRVVL